MIAVDANLPIYAYNRESKYFGRSSSWLEYVFNSEDTVGIPLRSVAAFLRIITDRRLRAEALSAAAAVSIVERWLERANVRLLYPGSQHWQLLRKLLIHGNVTGKLISDAQLAAIALEHGTTLYSADADFLHFPEIIFENPLETVV